MNEAFFPNVALRLPLARVVKPCFWGCLIAKTLVGLIVLGITNSVRVFHGREARDDVAWPSVPPSALSVRLRVSGKG